MRCPTLLSEHDWSGTWVTTLLWLHELQETTWRLNSSACARPLLADGLKMMPVRVDHERRVVGRAIVWP
ncbi:MAG: hypothetical protein ACI81R_001560 [Bradymonadia bacterium]|jgi:hypothetical protein